MTAAEDSLRNSDLEGALAALQTEVRSDPANVKRRIFLFQLLCVLGQWQRALTQLNVLGEMDAGTLMMVQTYRQAIQCEVYRNEVFSGRRTPLVFGQPQEWVAFAFEALRLTAQGQFEPAEQARARAFAAAPASSGRINGQLFEWIADADSRIGPFVEAIVDGRYYWIPFANIKAIELPAPEDLRDFVWIPANFTWSNAGQSVGLIPARYPLSDAADNEIKLARKTVWEQLDGDLYAGAGQRLLATDTDEYPVLDVRAIDID